MTEIGEMFQSFIMAGRLDKFRAQKVLLESQWSPKVTYPEWKPRGSELRLQAPDGGPVISCRPISNIAFGVDPPTEEACLKLRRRHPETPDHHCHIFSA